jgi:sulfhydrogenase subunit alpha
MPIVELDHIAKIEGHANLIINIEHNELKKLELDIIEGARFFENILKGKKFDELPLIASRICGVCSPAHAIASIQAIEAAFDIEPNEDVKLLRELLNIGGYLQSHALHLYFFVLPDYLGHDSVLHMTPKYKKEIERALRMKRAGNRILNVVGGRDIHSLTAVVGGFSKAPAKQSMESLVDELKAVQDDAAETYKLFSSLSYPDFEYASGYMALQGAEQTGDAIGFLEDGRLKQLPGDYETYMKEYFQHDSTAEFVVIEGKGYTVGPQARMNVNWEAHDKELMSQLSMPMPNYSPYSNVLFQSFELISEIERAISIVSGLCKHRIDVNLPNGIAPKPAAGIGVVEAPRGLLFYKFAFDERGYCTSAKVTTPTSQNLRMIEDCLQEFVSQHLHMSKENLIVEVEKLIRAFDPCISCSAH